MGSASVTDGATKGLGEMEDLRADAAVGLLGPNLVFVGANEAMLHFAARPAGELIGVCLRDALPDAPPSLFEDALRIARGDIRAADREIELSVAGERIRAHAGLYALRPVQSSFDAIRVVLRPLAPLRDEARELRQRLRFEELITDISGALSALPADDIDRAITGAIQRIVEHFDLDRSALFEVTEQQGEVHTRYGYSRPGIAPPPMIRADILFPWLWSRLKNNEVVSLSHRDEIPSEAVLDRQSMAVFGPQAIVVIPIHLGGRLAYLFTLESFGPMMQWPPELVTRQRLFGELIGMAAARKAAYLKLKHRLEFESTLRQISTLFINPAPDQFDEDVDVALRLLVELTGADRASIGIFSKSGDSILIRHDYSRDGGPESPTAVTRNALPWFAAEILDGRSVRIAASDGAAPEASREVELLRAEGIDSYFALPLHIQRKIFGFLGFASLKPEAQLGDESVRNLELAASIIANTLARRESDMALAALQEELEHENLLLKKGMASYRDDEMLVGTSPLMRGIMARVAQVGPTKATVLITGETGTGKELLAKAIHESSDRARKAMVKVNCAAIPATLIESELFGREQGAYTGAMTRQIGRFELANGSTIFLDEIGDLSTELQAKLLRVLQEGEFERLGSSKTIKVDVRVIAATNRDLAKAVRDGSFREDLYYRLRVFPLALPPLRDRADDIPQLVWVFVREFGRMMGKAIESIPRKDLAALQQYAWPGNIRELRNVIEHAMIVSSGKLLRIEPPVLGDGPGNPPITLDESVAKHIRQVLERTRWRIKGPGGAAEILDVNPATLRSKMKKLGIERPIH